MKRFVLSFIKEDQRLKQAESDFQKKLKLIYYRIKIPRTLMKYLKYLESKKFGFLKVKKNKIQLYSRITDIPAVGNYNVFSVPGKGPLS